MFSKASDKSRTQVVLAGAKKNQTPSIISASLRINGSVVTDGDIQLDGIIDGDVTSEDLTLGESAVINGSIEGNRVRVSGTVNGEISARYVELTSTAKVTGDINHTSLMIEAGAYVLGSCRHVEMTDAKPVARLAESAKANLIVAGKSMDGAKSAKANLIVAGKSMDGAKSAVQPKAAAGGKKA